MVGSPAALRTHGHKSENALSVVPKGRSQNDAMFPFGYKTTFHVMRMTVQLELRSS
jgi:hypothetical protein